MTASLEDRFALRDLVEAYARCADHVDGEGLAALFMPEGVLRIVRRGVDEPPAERIGREAIAKAIKGLDRYVKTFHFVGNHYVTIDGDEGTGEAYCVAHHLLGESGSQIDHVMMIRYQDQYRRQPDGWKLAVRELRVDWTEERTVTSP
jgi:SnoaL-like protein